MKRGRVKNPEFVPGGQTTKAVVTHQKGSWRWQDRFALVKYAEAITRDGRRVWKTLEVLNDKVKPNQAASLIASGIHRGSLNNKPIGSETLANAYRNPIPVGRFTPAKVRRTRSGDVQILLPGRH